MRDLSAALVHMFLVLSFDLCGWFVFLDLLHGLNDFVVKQCGYGLVKQKVEAFLSQLNSRAPQFWHN